MKTLLRKTLALVITLAPFSLAGCGGDEMPEEVLGYWVTSAPLYSDAGLDITSETITFSKGRDYLNVNTIKHVRVEREAEKTLVKITYKDKDAGDFILSVYYYPGSQGGTLRFVNQMKMVWRRGEPLTHE
jgi:hypothetical protein